jgi:hypothetical protein
MPKFSVVAEVTVTRAYHVDAVDSDHAVELVREDYDMMPYDVLEEDLASTVEVEQVD